MSDSICYSDNESGDTIVPSYKRQRIEEDGIEDDLVSVNSAETLYETETVTNDVAGTMVEVEGLPSESTEIEREEDAFSESTDVEEAGYLNDSTEVEEGFLLTNKKNGGESNDNNTGTEDLCELPHSLCAQVTADHQNKEEEREIVAKILMSPCCSNQCLLFLTGHDVLTARKKVCPLSVTSQRQWLIDKISDASYFVNGKMEISFSIASKVVCRAAFCLFYSFNSKKVSRTIKAVNNGGLISEHGNKGKTKESVKTSEAKTWMERYFNLIGDKLPHNGQIYLPSWETCKDIYLRHKEDMAIQQVDESCVISLSMFYKLWHDDFANVIIPEVYLTYLFTVYFMVYISVYMFPRDA